MNKANSYGMTLGECSSKMESSFAEPAKLETIENILQDLRKDLDVTLSRLGDFQLRVQGPQPMPAEKEGGPNTPANMGRIERIEFSLRELDRTATKLRGFAGYLEKLG